MKVSLTAISLTVLILVNPAQAGSWCIETVENTKLVVYDQYKNRRVLRVPPGAKFIVTDRRKEGAKEWLYAPKKMRGYTAERWVYGGYGYESRRYEFRSNQYCRAPSY